MKFVIILIIFTFTLLEAKDQSTKALGYKWSYAKLARPESAYFYAPENAIYVSNIAGEGTEKNSKGWISKLDSSGKVLDANWLSGLNAPKGIRISNGKLYVTDIDTVVIIELKNKRILERIKVKNAKFLNDLIVSSNNTIYVSDTPANIIYQIQNNKVSVFAAGEYLEHPNGLLINASSLVVAGWGMKMKKDWSTKVTGRLFTLDLKTKKKTLITQKPLGNLDGLEFLKSGGYLISDWVAGRVYQVDKKGIATMLYSGFKGSADIGYSPKDGLIFIPAMGENKLYCYEIK